MFTKARRGLEVYVFELLGTNTQHTDVAQIKNRQNYTAMERGPGLDAPWSVSETTDTYRSFRWDNNNNELNVFSEPSLANPFRD